MELVDLFELIQKTLAEQGFTLSSLFLNSTTNCYFVLGDELEKRAVSSTISYTAVYGYCIEVRKTAHRNGAKADTSYYLEIDEWDRSAAKVIKKIKLMRAQTKQTLVNKITKLVREYKQLLADIKLEKTIDKLLANK